MDQRPAPPEWEEHVGYPAGSRVRHKGTIYEAQRFTRALPNDVDGPVATRHHPGTHEPTWREIVP